MGEGESVFFIAKVPWWVHVAVAGLTQDYMGNTNYSAGLEKGKRGREVVCVGKGGGSEKGGDRDGGIGP